MTTPENCSAKMIVIFAAVPNFSHCKRLVLHLKRNPAETEVRTQETFAQALRTFDRYEAEANCRAWLSKIIFHKRSQRLRAIFAGLRVTVRDFRKEDGRTAKR